MRASSLMPSNMPSTIARRVKGAALSIIPTAGLNTCPFTTPSGWERPASNLRLAALATAMTMLAETINGLFKSEVIHCRGPWRSVEAVEYAVLEWVDWFNNRRLLGPIGNIPPAEAAANFDAALETKDMAA